MSAASAAGLKPGIAGWVVDLVSDHVQLRPGMASPQAAKGLHHLEEVVLGGEFAGVEQLQGSHTSAFWRGRRRRRDHRRQQDQLALVLADSSRGHRPDRLGLALDALAGGRDQPQVLDLAPWLVVVRGQVIDPEPPRERVRSADLLADPPAPQQHQVEALLGVEGLQALHRLRGAERAPVTERLGLDQLDPGCCAQGGRQHVALLGRSQQQGHSHPGQGREHLSNRLHPHRGAVDQVHVDLAVEGDADRAADLHLRLRIARIWPRVHRPNPRERTRPPGAAARGRGRPGSSSRFPRNSECPGATSRGRSRLHPACDQASLG